MLYDSYNEKLSRRPGLGRNGTDMDNGTPREISDKAEILHSMKAEVT